MLNFEQQQRQEIAKAIREMHEAYLRTEPPVQIVDGTDEEIPFFDARKMLNPSEPLLNLKLSKEPIGKLLTSILTFDPYEALRDAEKERDIL